MQEKAKAKVDIRDHSFKEEVVLFHPIQRSMRREMDLAWKDFFDKNPDVKKEDVWRRVEERLRSEQNSKDGGKEECAFRKREKIVPLIRKPRG